MSDKTFTETVYRMTNTTVDYTMELEPDADGLGLTDLVFKDGCGDVLCLTLDKHMIKFLIANLPRVLQDMESAEAADNS